MVIRTVGVVVAATLAAAVPAGRARAQQAHLAVNVSPDPNRVDAGLSKLTFSAIVPAMDPDLFHVLVCRGPTVTDACWSTANAKVDGKGEKYMTIVFPAAYAVPSTAAAGDELCSILRQRMAGLSGIEKYGLSPYTRLATECQRVSVPNLRADAGAPNRASAVIAAPGQPQPARRASAAVRPPGSARVSPGAAERGTGGMLPDLSISFTKAPVAKWVVRNTGQAPSPPTVVRFARVSVPEADRPVPALAPGALYEILVTPDLDVYLVNATATVDPDRQVKEGVEWNNEWKSSESR